MAAADYALIQLEESPVYENAATGGSPYRIATEKLFLPIDSALLSPKPAYKDRSAEMRSIAGAVPKLIDTFAPDGQIVENAYPHDLTWLLELAGFAGTMVAGGPTVAGPESTTATGVNALNSATVNVGSTANFAAAGSFILGGVATTYTGITATSFTGCGNHAATVGGETISDNIPVGVNMWTYAKRLGIVPRTAQVICNYADEAVQLKGNGFAVSQLALTADGQVTASLLGMVLKRLAVDSATVPAYSTQAVPPLRRGDLSLTWLGGGGAVQDFSLSLTNPLTPVRSLSLTPPSNYPDLMEFGDAQAQLTGSIPKRILAAGDIDALLAGTTFSARARFKTSKVIGATTYTYTAIVEMPACQYVGGDADALGNKRRHGATFNFEAAYDETTGRDVRIYLVNDVAAIGASVGLPF